MAKDQRIIAPEETNEKPAKELTADELGIVSGGGSGRDDAMTGGDKDPSGITVL